MVKTVKNSEGGREGGATDLPQLNPPLSAVRGCRQKKDYKISNILDIPPKKMSTLKDNNCVVTGQY